MKRTILIMLVGCSALIVDSCRSFSETSFFSNFSTRQLVQHTKSSAGLNCDALGGGGGGIGSRVGGVGPGGAHFNSHKSDSCGCQLVNGGFDETRLFSDLKLELERALQDNGAQITDTGSSGPANFHISYAVKNVHGRVQLSGTRIGKNYYNVSADLDETGN
jgi:hypothetical protein